MQAQQHHEHQDGHAGRVRRLRAEMLIMLTVDGYVNGGIPFWKIPFGKCVSWKFAYQECLLFGRLMNRQIGALESCRFGKIVLENGSLGRDIFGKFSKLLLHSQQKTRKTRTS